MSCGAGNRSWLEIDRHILPALERLEEENKQLRAMIVDLTKRLDEAAIPRLTIPIETVEN